MSVRLSICSSFSHKVKPICILHPSFCDFYAFKLVLITNTTRLRSLVSSSSCLSMWCHLQLDEYSRCIWMNEWIWDLDKRAAGKSVFVSIIFILFSGPSTKLLVPWPLPHSQPGVEQYVAQFVEDHRTQDHNDASDIDNGKGKTSKQKKIQKEWKWYHLPYPPPPYWKSGK